MGGNVKETMYCTIYVSLLLEPLLLGWKPVAMRYRSAADCLRLAGGWLDRLVLDKVSSCVLFQFNFIRTGKVFCTNVPLVSSS
jgi:hypothetical protein